MKKVRMDLRLPEMIVELVDKYKEENGLTTRTSAIIEMVKKASETPKTNS